MSLVGKNTETIARAYYGLVSAKIYRKIQELLPPDQFEITKRVYQSSVQTKP